MVSEPFLRGNEVLKVGVEKDHEYLFGEIIREGKVDCGIRGLLLDVLTDLVN